jgi:hypothetical protein
MMSERLRWEKTSAMLLARAEIRLLERDGLFHAAETDEVAATASRLTILLRGGPDLEPAVTYHSSGLCDRSLRLFQRLVVQRNPQLGLGLVLGIQIADKSLVRLVL